MRRLAAALSLSLLLPALLVACGDKEDTQVPEGDTDTDTDADTDADADSDADSDVAQYGPDNAWWHANASDVPEGLSGTGWGVGDTAHNFTLVDQNGDEVELYQFYGRVVLLDLFADW
jgi:cytochrome oxidase Cu insertion factor (SCO1/SenC/PrrC family)